MAFGIKTKKQEEARADMEIIGEDKNQDTGNQDSKSQETKDQEAVDDIGEDEDDGQIHEVGTDKFPCPSCGGNMEFSPDEQKLQCPYCKTVVEIENEETDVREYNLRDAEDKASHNWGGDKVVFKCSNCGGATVVDSSAKASFCSFCGSSHVVKTDEKAGIKPETMVPFKINSDKAKKKFKSWIKGKFFAPGQVKKDQTLERLQGVYIPFFTYDSSSNTAYTAKRGTHYYTTRTKVVNGKTVTERVRHTRWTTVRGVYSNYFDDVLVNVSRNIDDDLVKRMGGYNLRKLLPYKAEYMSGFIAEKYSLSLNEGWYKAKMDIDDSIDQGIRRQVGGDEFRLLNKNTDYGQIKYKHVLLPLWMSAYKYKEKIYKFLVNGQTGKVSGQYPKSPFKIAGVVLTVALIGLIGYLIYTYR
jgi:DNA-directed RNA polymerase subunit RPC12/RpoP